MKKILITILLLISPILVINSWATVGWNKSIPATSENPQAISPDVIENNTALDLMLQDYRSGHVSLTLVSTSEIDIGPGGVMLQNAGGSVRLMVANSSLTAMAPANIDTGSISPSSTYYIYAYASSTTATTFSVIYSASSTAPTGITYYARLGSFTTNGSSNFFSVQSDVLTGAIGSILNYGSSSSTSSAVAQTNLKIAYGTVTVGTNSTVTITNLPFTSASTYSISVNESNTGVSQPIYSAIVSGSSFTITNVNVTYSMNISWTAIGY